MFQNDTPIYKPEYFSIQELVPPIIYKYYKERSWMFLDARLLWTLDALREHFKAAIYMNDWDRGGTLSNRGFRSFEQAIALGARHSQHSFGRAADFDAKDLSAEEVRQEIITGKKSNALAFRFITTIEDRVQWVHIDLRNTLSDELLILEVK